MRDVALRIIQWVLYRTVNNGLMARANLNKVKTTLWWDRNLSRQNPSCIPVHRVHDLRAFDSNFEVDRSIDYRILFGHEKPFCPLYPIVAQLINEWIQYKVSQKQGLLTVAWPS